MNITHNLGYNPF